MEITLTFRVEVNEDKMADYIEQNGNNPTTIESLIGEAISAWEYEGLVETVIEAEGKEE